MTEHIIQFGVGIDDDAIIKAVKDKAETVIIRDIEKELLEKIFTGSYYGRKAVYIDARTDAVEVSSDAQFTDFAEGVIKETVSKYKDEIIRMAATMLADGFKRTKAWKEAAGEAVRKD